MTVTLGFQLARHQRVDILGRWGEHPGIGRAPVPSLGTPEEE